MTRSEVSRQHEYAPDQCACWGPGGSRSRDEFASNLDDGRALRIMSPSCVKQPKKEELVTINPGLAQRL